MNLLAVDTATEKISIALAADKDTGHQDVGYQDTGHQDVWLFEADAGLRHSEMVMEIIDMLFKKAALERQDLSGIVCMACPGSFTGLRIGFSLAKGLALALGCPFAAIPTLDCMAWPLSSWKGFVMPVLDAKKSSFFCALYRDGRKACADMDAGPAAIADEIASAITAACAGQADAAKQVLLTGPAADMLYEKLTRLPQSQSTPLTAADIVPGKGLRWGNAQTLLEMARQTDIFAKNITDFSAGPEYIRKSDAERGWYK
jgi:tRNA threonylcarbamoyladenosine biosynthesis protein TsaB